MFINRGQKLLCCVRKDITVQLASYSGEGRCCKTQGFSSILRYRVSRGKKCSFFWKTWRALFSCNTRFEIHPFVLLPTSIRPGM